MLNSNHSARKIDNLLPRRRVVNRHQDIETVDIYKDAEQQRVLPRQVSTGNNRGEMTVRGSMRIVDNTNNTRLVLGYRKAGF